MENFLLQSQYFLNILLAAVCGFLIGFERKSKFKEAGIRTHAFVCSGSALIMIISIHAFDALNVEADRARIAAQIVSGIGFLGAGIIVYRKQVLRGLTTAAGVWMASGIGMAAGAGMHYLAILSTFLILFIHFVLSLPLKLFKTKRFFGLKLEFSCTDKEHSTVKQIFGVSRFSSIEYRRADEGYIAQAEIYTQEYIEDDILLNILQENNCISSIKRILE